MTVAATWIHGRRSPDVMSAATAARGGRVTTVRPLCDRLAHDTTDTDRETSDVCTSGCAHSSHRFVSGLVSRRRRQGPSVSQLDRDFAENCSLDIFVEFLRLASRSMPIPLILAKHIFARDRLAATANRTAKQREKYIIAKMYKNTYKINISLFDNMI